jgi:hypothetical protein
VTRWPTGVIPVPSPWGPAATIPTATAVPPPTRARTVVATMIRRVVVRFVFTLARLNLSGEPLCPERLSGRERSTPGSRQGTLHGPPGPPVAGTGCPVRCWLRAGFCRRGRARSSAEGRRAWSGLRPGRLAVLWGLRPFRRPCPARELPVNNYHAPDRRDAAASRERLTGPPSSRICRALSARL